VAGRRDGTLKQACFQGYPESAVYVQVSIDSRNSAIHNAYHSSLCPSSLFEPRHRSLKVVNKRKIASRPHTRCAKHANDKEDKERKGMDREWVATSTEKKRDETSAHPALSRPRVCYARISRRSRYPPTQRLTSRIHGGEMLGCVRMILPQVHLRKPCYDFSFL
jgi:hypothetical protein